MKKVALIMAGGHGNRLYPLRQKKYPKQFLKLYNNKTLIENTIKRIKSIDEIVDIYIITNEDQKKIMTESVGKLIKKSNIIYEPKARNTSACIGLACMKIKRKYNDCVLCVFSTDHYIKDEIKFCDIISNAMKFAENNDSIVTLGIKPTFASTDFGYIKFLGPLKNDAMIVENFIEKPSKPIAEGYVNSGQYLWNSGIFIWKISTLLDLYKIYLPDISTQLNEIYNKNKLSELKRIYPMIRNISVDKGIMENAKEAYVFNCDVGWLDIGRLDYLDMVLEKDDQGNYFDGIVYGKDSKNCTVFSDNSMVTLIGVDDLVVINKNNITLICKKESIDKINSIQDIIEGKKG